LFGDTPTSQPSKTPTKQPYGEPSSQPSSQLLTRHINLLIIQVHSGRLILLLSLHIVQAINLRLIRYLNPPIVQVINLHPLYYLTFQIIQVLILHVNHHLNQLISHHPNLLTLQSLCQPFVQVVDHSQGRQLHCLLTHPSQRPSVSHRSPDVSATGSAFVFPFKATFFATLTADCGFPYRFSAEPALRHLHVSTCFESFIVSVFPTMSLANFAPFLSPNRKTVDDTFYCYIS
jgi:hypothetical protein